MYGRCIDRRPVLLITLLCLLVVFTNAAQAVAYPGIDIFIDEHKVDDEALAKKAAALVDSLEQENHTRLDSNLTINAYNNRRLYEQRAPEGAVGYALPTTAQIHIRRDIEDFDRVLAHEISHIVFLRSVPADNSLPRWFIEGLAVFQSKPNLKSYLYQQKALESDLDKFEDLDMTNDSALAASQGFLAIDFMVEEYGQAGLDAVIIAIQDGVPFRDAIESGLGVDYSVIESGWTRFKGERRSWFEIAAFRNIGLLIIGFLVLITPFIWSWRQSRRFRELKDEEVSESETIAGDDYELWE